jgi:hypothetical protein
LRALHLDIFEQPVQNRVFQQPFDMVKARANHVKTHHLGLSWQVEIQHAMAASAKDKEQKDTGQRGDTG